MTNLDVAINEVCNLRRRLDEVKAELAAANAIIGNACGTNYKATVDRLRGELSDACAERDALAEALWSAEDQWGDDYLWDKWELSKPLTVYRKQALIDAKKGTTP